jgi:anti-sigma factor RsiW
MNNNPLYDRMREQRWRRPLTAAEAEELKSWLAAHPESRPDWAAEAGLGAALDQLPDVPVASNFTARVLQAVEREKASAERQPLGWLAPGTWWRRWAPRVALAGLLVTTGAISYRHFETARQAEVALSVATISDVSSLPSPEILKDFEAIQALNQTPPADEELLALLQ